MLAGPIFHRELAVAPRGTRLYIYRATYAATLALLMSTAWLVLAGVQNIRSVGDMARFGAILFQILCPLQLAVVVFFAALAAASAVAQEKDRRTLILLLMTRMENRELVLGKLGAALLHVVVLVAAGLPILTLAMLFGGVSSAQLIRVVLVTLASAFVAGSLGTLLAFWREKTFQTLALTALVLCLWSGFWLAVSAGYLGCRWGGLSTARWAVAMSPAHAIMAAARPLSTQTHRWLSLGSDIQRFLVASAGIGGVLLIIAIARVRVWNPSREVRPHVAAVEQRSALATSEQVDRARAGHVDSQLRLRASHTYHREVWDNPILWREICTWAYGRKINLIRAAYLVFFAFTAAAVHFTIVPTDAVTDVGSRMLSPIAMPLGVLLLVSLVMVNALAVTSVTTERDGKSIDLLLATDLTPREFVFGKLGGILSVAGLMFGLPVGLLGYTWFQGGLLTENLVYLVVGWAVMNLFAGMLGLHCGMRYSNSRSAVAISLGTVFFLFLGVVACLLMMVSFHGSFQVQLGPFLAFILGGGVGLYVLLGAGNPSKAIGVAAILLPLFTFHAITSFLLRHNLLVFLVTTATYGFTTAAMMIPALYEFDFAMGRTSHAEEV
ncbi:MAG: ABC transporter permease subunit [Planctomycetales bacterium]|nr:ABC transporter permease subunit [Planctomycetales bacterium]